MGGSRRSTWTGVLVVAALVVGGLAACGDDGDDASTGTSTTVVQAIDVSSGDFPPALSTYEFTTSRHAGDEWRAFDESQFGAPAGSIEAVFYFHGDVGAIYLKGLSPTVAEDKCVIVFDEPWGDHSSFTSYQNDACEREGLGRQLALPPGSLRLCGGRAIVVVTDIDVRDSPSLGVDISQYLGPEDNQSLFSSGPVHPDAPSIDVRGCEPID